MFTHNETKPPTYIVAVLSIKQSIVSNLFTKSESETKDLLHVATARTFNPPFSSSSPDLHKRQAVAVWLTQPLSHQIVSISLSQELGSFVT